MSRRRGRTFRHQADGGPATGRARRSTNAVQGTWRCCLQRLDRQRNGVRVGSSAQEEVFREWSIVGDQRPVADARAQVVASIDIQRKEPVHPLVRGEPSGVGSVIDVLEDAGPREDFGHRRPVEVDGAIGAEQVEPMPAGSGHHAHVGKHVEKRPDVGEEVIERLAIRDPLHHHAVGIEAGLGRLVELERRDDRHARTLDRRRWIDDDEVIRLVRELHVVAAVGNDDPTERVLADLGGIAVEPGKHVDNARDELDRVRLHASGQRSPEGRPHSKGDDESSIGVGTQHDRQQRHELRVDREGRHRASANPEPADPTQLACLDGGDLILRRLEHTSRHALR